MDMMVYLPTNLPYKNKPFMWVNIPFVPWMSHGQQVTTGRTLSTSGASWSGVDRIYRNVKVTFFQAHKK